MLGNYIRSLRKEKNLTLAALSAATNLSPGYLSQVERGIADPSLSSLRRIASALDIPAMLLLDDLDSRRRPSRGTSSPLSISPPPIRCATAS